MWVFCSGSCSLLLFTLPPPPPSPFIKFSLFSTAFTSANFITSSLTIPGILWNAFSFKPSYSQVIFIWLPIPEREGKKGWPTPSLRCEQVSWLIRRNLIIGTGYCQRGYKTLSSSGTELWGTLISPATLTCWKCNTHSNVYGFVCLFTGKQYLFCLVKLRVTSSFCRRVILVGNRRVLCVLTLSKREPFN